MISRREFHKVFAALGLVAVGGGKVIAERDVAPTAEDFDKLVEQTEFVDQAYPCVSLLEAHYEDRIGRFSDDNPITTLWCTDAFIKGYGAELSEASPFTRSPYRAQKWYSYCGFRLMLSPDLDCPIPYVNTPTYIIREDGIPALRFFKGNPVAHLGPKYQSGEMKRGARIHWVKDKTYDMMIWHGPIDFP